MDVVIGLDCGTTATKAVAVGVDATVRAVAKVGYPLLVPAPGRAELDAVRLAQSAIKALADTSALVRERGDRVVGLCVGAAMHGLVRLGADGAPLGPLVTWADTRAGDEARELTEATGGALHGRTGTPVHPMSPLVKLAWWRRHEPETFAATPRWGGVKEVLLAALCETEFLVDLSAASATGMYDIFARRWDPEALSLAGVTADQLPTVVPTTHRVAGLRPEVANATGLPGGVPVIVGASDGALANLGLGAIGDGVAAVSVGTSGAIRAMSRVPTVDEARQLFCYALTDDRWVIGGAINNAGSVVRWASGALGPTPTGPGATTPAGTAFTEEARQAADIALLAEAGAVPPGSDGLLCLPYLMGERAPWWTPGLQGAWIGLRRYHTRGHLVRSAVEGVCQQLALVARAMADAGVQVRTVRATGGSVESALWCGILAATLDLPVEIAASPEGTGTGAAMLGHHALGALADLDEVAELIAVHRGAAPDPGAVATYARLRPLIEQSTRALLPVFHTLNEIPETPEDPKTVR
ncbi:MAG TPA: gluconokinase [Micromonosporaceae bacterium]|nr:gluconokinase [Micromonosporaceae bacterium]